MTLTFTIESMRGPVRFRVPDVQDYSIQPDGTLDVTRSGLFGTEDGRADVRMYWDEIYRNAQNVTVLGGAYMGQTLAKVSPA